MGQLGHDARPEPPYWAVIFTSHRTDGGDAEYGRTAARMEQLAQTIPGYLGIESARGSDGMGITVSYWESEEAIAEWRDHPEHLVAKERGRAEWYEHWELRVARVERASFHQS